MCGICGMAGPLADSERVLAMCRILRHRGPDDLGIHVDGKVVLGHTRLSIIDLATGDQPMSGKDGRIWVVYNGEIYNFKELRSDLTQRGHHFITTSDTEVLIHGYEEYGVDLFRRLNGIFSFALWDSGQKKLFLVRDYFGVKPLHYHFLDKTLRFASECKAILLDNRVERAPDFQAIHYFMNLRYIPGERTLFAGIKRLLPGHYLLYENNAISVRKYWQEEAPAIGEYDEKYYIEGIRHHLGRAVEKQLVSDVPVGVFLSGGLDSSALVAYMHRVVGDGIPTFALGFNEPTDELDDARLVAQHFNTDHHEIAIDADPLKNYPSVIWHAEEPKENIVQGYLLSAFAGEHVKVVQGGLGGDELFGGYSIYKYIQAGDRFHGMIPGAVAKNIFAPLRRFAYQLQNSSRNLRFDEFRRGVQLLLSVGNPQQYYQILRNVWDHDSPAFAKIYGQAMRDRKLSLAGSLFDPCFSMYQGTGLEQVLATEFHTKMVDDFLANEDRTSMAHGLEVRVPFLDRDLVRFAAGIPGRLKIRNGETKYIFRRAMEGILPDHAVRKKKWGFTFDPCHQFEKDLKGVAQRVLTRESVTRRGWFNYDYLRTIIEYPPSLRLRWHYFHLWLVMGLEIWCQMFIDPPEITPPSPLDDYYS